MFCIAYTLLMTGSSIYTLSIYYLSLAITCLYEYNYQKNWYKKYLTIVYSLAVYLLVNSYILDMIDRTYLTLILPLSMSLFTIELFVGKGNPMLNIGTDLIGLVWICLPLLLTIALSYTTNGNGIKTHDSRIVYGIMIYVFVSDGGAYFAGKYLGSHKLFPSISPKKTWEGLIGGGITSLICYYPITTYIGVLDNNTWLVVGIMSVMLGAIGDLIESMFKRELKVKDAGSILPGHGGVLDRIDGLLYSVPFIYSYLVLSGAIQ